MASKAAYCISIEETETGDFLMRDVRNKFIIAYNEVRTTSSQSVAMATVITGDNGDCDA